MAQLAIQGHKTRGSEVIALLKMLGGKNTYQSIANTPSLYYYIAETYGVEVGKIYCGFVEGNINFVTYTLEEFKAKFPYKIGDKVIVNNEVEIINRMYWDGNEVKYGFFTTNNLGELGAKTLQPYKEQPTREEVMRDYIATQETMENKGTLVEIDLTRELSIANKVRIILGDYEVKEEDGETYLVKKKPKYPKTYEECCKVLEINPALELKKQVIVGWNIKLLCNLQQLLICRDAYWKIAGEEMGLGKPWEPDDNTPEDYYYIVNKNGKLHKDHYFSINHILKFPTIEMRDAFYENFKDLIEQCKELL